MKKLKATAVAIVLSLGANAQQGIWISAGQLGHNIAQVNAENTHTKVVWKKSTDTTNVLAYGQYKVDATTEPGSMYELSAHSVEYNDCGDVILDTTYYVSMGQGNNYPVGNVKLQNPKFLLTTSVDTLRATANWILTQPGDSASIFWMYPNGKRYYGFDCPLTMDTTKSRYGAYYFFLQIWRQNNSGVGTYEVGHISASVQLRNKTKLFAPWSDRTVLAPNSGDSILLVAEPGYQKYVWLKDGYSIPKSNSDSIWVKIPGDYKYTGTYNGTKFRSGICNIYTLGCPLRMAQNVMSGTEDKKFHVYDMTGRLIYEGVQPSNMENYPTGIYIIRKDGKSQKMSIAR